MTDRNKAWPSSTTTGRRGEEMAIRHCRGLGFEILATNYRKPFGEVDIVARDGRTIVFVEVKTRRSQAFGSPFEAVDARKQRQLVRIALDFLQCRDLTDVAARFDVIAITVDQKGQPMQLEHLRHAFEAND
jgi:putative endonuclease